MEGQRTPLAGVRVLELSHIIAGPFCGTILADLGAEVIKIEPPGGERARVVEPIVGEGADAVSAFFQTLNRNRRGCVLDLKSASGREAMVDLVRVSDVLVENFAPGTMARLQLDYDVLRRVNPSLIYVAITGFGELNSAEGPYSRWRANNATSQAMSGLMELSGDAEGPPAFVGGAVGDTVPGLWATIGVLAALEQRRRTGVGQFVDAAMYDCLAAMCYNSLTDFHVKRVPPRRGEPGWQTTFTTRLQCRDGYIAVSMWGGDARAWDGLWQEIGRPDMQDRSKFEPMHPGCETCATAVEGALHNWLTSVNRWDAVALLLRFGFSAGPVQNAAEVYSCPQLASRGFFVEIGEGPTRVRTAGLPLKFSDVDAVPTRPAPRIGEHTEEILSSLLGYSGERLQELCTAAMNAAYRREGRTPQE